MGSNLKQHGVSFDDATTVFRDTLSITISDPDHSELENRFIDIGMSHRGEWYRTRSGKTKFESSAPDERPVLNRRTMKKQSRRKRSEERDTLRPEYDFSKGVRGKHAAKYAEGTNVVVLEADVARDFRTSEEVNETLRAVSKMIRQYRKRSSRKTA